MKNGNSQRIAKILSVFIFVLVGNMTAVFAGSPPEFTPPLGESDKDHPPGGYLSHTMPVVWHVGEESPHRSIVVDESYHYEDFSMGICGGTSCKYPKNGAIPVEGEIKINNGAVFSIHNYYSDAALIGADIESIGINIMGVNSSLTVSGTGTFRVVLTPDLDMTGGKDLSTHWQNGSAVYLERGEPIEGEMSAPEFNVEGVNLELIGNRGLEVESGHVNIDNYANGGHVWIGVDPNEADEIYKGPMVDGLEIKNGDSSVNIKTHDFRIYSRGFNDNYDEGEPSAKETGSLITSTFSVSGKRVLGIDQSINIKADRMVLKAKGQRDEEKDYFYAILAQGFGGESYKGVAEWNSDFKFSGESFLLETDWNGISAQSFGGQTDISLDFKDIVINSTVDETLSAWGWLGARANISLKADNIVISATNATEADGGKTILSDY